MRIGVNWGSLDPELLARMMDENGRSAEPLDATEVMREALDRLRARIGGAGREARAARRAHRHLLQGERRAGPDRVYRELARRCDYALHLGLTEAGMGSKGIVASTAAMAVLLQEGIGDTIRVSLTPEPNGDRTAK